MPWTLVVVLVLFIPLLGLNYYVGRRIYLAFRDLTSWSAKGIRLWLTLVFVLLNLLPPVYLGAYFILGRSVTPLFAGDSFLIDLFFSYPFWIGLIIFVQTTIFFVGLDILSIPVYYLIPARRSWLKRTRSYVVLSLIGIVGLLAIITVVQDTWTVKIVKEIVPLPRGYEDLKGFRIAQISDVQGDGRTTPSMLRRYVAGVNELKPDLVVFAGDLVTSGLRYINSTADILGELKSKYGTVAALGDHDIWSQKSMVLAALRSNGINVIEDSTIAVGSDGRRIALSVVTYTYPQKPKNSDMSRLEGTPFAGYRIMLVHQPAEQIVNFAHENGYQLLLAGHTHGGGVAFGIPGLFLLAPANLESKYISGLYRVGGMFVSVTNGLGLTLAPVRFNAPAEVTLLTLE